MVNFQYRKGFTIIELMVVITIIAMLLSLLLPTLKSSRDISKALKCGGVQRNLFAVFSSYAEDYKEFPTNYNHDMPTSWNWGDECSGRMNGLPPSNTTYVYATPPYYYPIQGYSALERVFLSGHLTPETIAGNVNYWTINPAILCTGELPRNYRSQPNNGSSTIFNYNGPNTNSSTIKNNGGLSGLYYLGQHGAGGETWGYSYRYPTLRNTPASIAFFGCPSYFEYTTSGTATGIMCEPHGNQPQANYTALGYGNGQTDENGARLSYNRNYTFSDGHGKYLVTPTRANLP